jgi:hypothetical protein
VLTTHDKKKCCVVAFAEVIALDTEYHDPEEIHAMLPHLFPQNSADARSTSDDDTTPVASFRPMVGKTWLSTHCSARNIQVLCVLCFLFLGV